MVTAMSSVQYRHAAYRTPTKKHSLYSNAALPLSCHTSSPGYLYTDNSCTAVPRITAYQVGDISAHKSSFGSQPCCSRNFVNRNKEEKDGSGARWICLRSACTLQVLLNRMNDAARKSPYIPSKKMAETKDNGKCHAP